MTCWVKKIDAANLDERVGVILSRRELLVAARDIEDEVGHDELAAMPIEQLELAFAALQSRREVPIYDLKSIRK